MLDLKDQQQLDLKYQHALPVELAGMLFALPTRVKGLFLLQLLSQSPYLFTIHVRLYSKLAL